MLNDGQCRFGACKPENAHWGAGRQGSFFRRLKHKAGTNGNAHKRDQAVKAKETISEVFEEFLIHQEPHLNPTTFSQHKGARSALR